MVKKIIGGILLAGLIGVLIFGAVNRTIAKGGDSNQRSDITQLENPGWGLNEDPESEVRSSQRNNQNSFERNQNGDFGNSSSTSGQSRGSGSGRGGGQAQNADGLRESNEDDTSDRFLITAVFIGIDGDYWILQSIDGTSVELRGRTLRYIQDKGFSIAIGDVLSLEGFYEANGRFVIIKITNAASGQSLQIRDAYGRPAWAGSGNFQY